MERTVALNSLISTWSAPERAAFVQVRHAAESFSRISSRNEIDQMGTMGGVFVSWAAESLNQAFVVALFHFEGGQLPNFSIEESGLIENNLEALYVRVRSSKLLDTTITLEGIAQAQQAWLNYREAWVKFGLIKYPNVKPEGWRSWLALERIKMLQELLPKPPGPSGAKSAAEPPQGSAFAGGQASSRSDSDKDPCATQKAEADQFAQWVTKSTPQTLPFNRDKLAAASAALRQCRASQTSTERPQKSLQTDQSFNEPEMNVVGLGTLTSGSERGNVVLVLRLTNHGKTAIRYDALKCSVRTAFDHATVTRVETPRTGVSFSYHDDYTPDQWGRDGA